MPPAMPMATALSEKLEKADRGEMSLQELKELVETLKTQKELDGIRAGEVHDIFHEPKPAPTEESIQNKQLVESLSRLTQSLIEEMKELRKTKQPAAPASAPKGGLP